MIIPAGTLTDESGNSSKTTEMIVYNTLKKAYTGTYEDEKIGEGTEFLGNQSYPVVIRGNIDNITFKDSIPVDVRNDETIWDVSAMGDNSILEWYTTNANGSIKVYIGSDDEIFANQNSTLLFAYIGYNERCTSTETITNIGLLNVTGVTNMRRMFEDTGYNAMTKLDLGSKFDTSNVTDMFGMFVET